MIPDQSVLRNTAIQVLKYTLFEYFEYLSLFEYFTFLDVFLLVFLIK